MTDRIEIHGRVNGVPKFHYGPRNFDSDWGGVFTAFEIANYMTKLPKVTMGKRSPTVFRRVGRIVEKRNLQKMLSLFHVTIVALPIDRIDLWCNQKRWDLTDKIHTTRSVESASNSTLVDGIIQALIKMDLNKWGIVGALATAFSSYDHVKITGRLSASVFITLR